MPDDSANKPPPRPSQPFHGDMSPGDEAPEGTPGTGQTVCSRCAGSGRSEGAVCPDCEGSGYVIAGIGGA